MTKVGIDQIIEVDPNTFDLKLTPFATTIDVFKDIIRRDRGSEGDAQGRKKFKAIDEIVYCYFMEKYGTVFFNWEETKRHDEVCKRLKREIDQDDTCIIALRSFLKQGQRTPSMEALTEVKESYHSSTKMLRVLRQILERRIDTLSEMANDPFSLDPDNEEDATEMLFKEIDASDKLLGKIKNNALDFNKVLTLIKDLEEKVKTEQSEERQIKGGGSVSRYEQ